MDLSKVLLVVRSKQKKRFAKRLLRTGLDDAAVVAFAQLVPFLTDSNAQAVFLVRIKSVAQDVDPVQVQFEAVLFDEQILLHPI